MATRVKELITQMIYVHTHHKGVYDHLLSNMKHSESIVDFHYEDEAFGTNVTAIIYSGYSRRKMEYIATMLFGAANALLTIDNFPNALGKKPEVK